MIPDEAVEAALSALFGNGAFLYMNRYDVRKALEAAAPHLLAEAVARVQADNDHIEAGSGAYSSGFHYALQCIHADDEPYRSQP